MSTPRTPNLVALLATAALTLGGVAATLAAPGAASANGMAANARAAHVHHARVQRAGHRRMHRHRHHAHTSRHGRHVAPVESALAVGSRVRTRSASHRGRHSHNSVVVSVSGSAHESAAETIANVLAKPCADTDLTPEPGNIAEVDAATLCLVNQERARNGELPLTVNAQLQQAAQSHSEEMISEDYFAHVSPSGQTPVERVEATGYVPSSTDGYTIGENIAWGTLALSTPSSIVAAWIASPEHLANILYSPYRDTAVAVVPAVPVALAGGQPGAIYSQVFGVIVP